MPKCWLVRAGEGSRHAVDFATSNAIAIGWNDIPGLDDLRSMEKPEIAKLLREAGRSSGVAAADAQEMLDFRDNIGLGSVVITPDATAGEILVGEVAGDYEYRAEVPVGDYNHVRTVEWYGRYGRDQLSPELRKDTNFRRTIRALDDEQGEWAALAELMKTGGAVSVLDRRGTIKRTSTMSAARRRAEQEITTRLCSACGMQKATSQFVAGSEHCVDCR